MPRRDLEATHRRDPPADPDEAWTGGPYRLRIRAQRHRQPIIRLAIVDGLDVQGSRFHNYPPRWNGAPSQEMLVIRRNHHTGEVSLDPLRWGLIPYWCEDQKGGRKPINAKCEMVSKLPSFGDAYRRRRCILPIDGFFEWKAIKGKAKQPYAIAMRDGYPFGLGGVWENWKDPISGGADPDLCDYHH